MGYVVGNPHDPRQLEMDLAELHREISGARRVSVKAGPTSMLLEVRGCPNFSRCSSSSDPTFCMPDLLIAAVIQRAMQTPVSLAVKRDKHGCTHEYKPAWLANLVSEIEEYGAEGMLVLHRDRIVYSHMPTDRHKAALSEGLLIKEETEELHETEYRMHDLRIMMMNFGSISVSVCLKPAGANELRIRERIRVALEQDA
jgi:hypothetical protein